MFRSVVNYAKSYTSNKPILEITEIQLEGNLMSFCPKIFKSFKMKDLVFVIASCYNKVPQTE